MGATLLSLFLGSIAGAVAGFYRGWADTTISRLVDLTMAFPYLLFVITLAGTLGTRLNHVTFGFLGEGVVTLILVFGLLGWFYSARVMRSVALSLREKEFVEAARMVGASNWRIIRSHVFPHLVGPLIVLATLNVAAFILAEAGLSFLGLGIQLPTASWGNLLADAPQYYTSRPLLMVWPGVALLFTTLAFNLLGDGLRDAFDPRGVAGDPRHDLDGTTASANATLTARRTRRLRKSDGARRNRPLLGKEPHERSARDRARR